MNNSRLTLKQWLRRIAGSIAFYPSLIAIAFIALALLIIWVEYQPWMMQFKHTINMVLVESVEDGRLVLGTLVAGTISLMVFSFSMVMVVLNQASANLSPRLLPGLITVKDNQVVLGFYLGTICYCFMLIINNHPSATEAKIPSFGIFVGMCLGLTCLGLFTYFIHSISQSIQVDNILDRLFNQTQRKVEKGHCQDALPEPSSGQWYDLFTPKAGYLKWIQEEELLAFCKKNDVCLQMVERIGHFFVEDTVYIRATKELTDEQKQKIHQCFMFYPQEKPGDHYSFGFKQISEIAVKALSPGINDPATAIKAVDMLVMLFINKSNLNEIDVLFDSDKQPRIFLKETDLNYLLNKIITPIRAYAKNDPLVMQHLIEGLFKIWINNQNNNDKRILREHMQAMRDTCDRALLNAMDRANINDELKAINTLMSDNEIALLT